VCWVKSPEVEPRAKSRLNRAIYRRLAEEDIEIPFPQRTIHHAEESQDTGVEHGAPGSDGGGD
ncbi:MAG: mechanosensitive ion channel family protein, partial [Candidatus Nanohaloarchaea archaeon]|nr:mechanosensitive ion channel family protein [Candidatus Nanohaloarchaea archaeon]